MIPAKVALANNATCNRPSAAAVPNSTIVNTSRPISTTTGVSASRSDGSRGGPARDGGPAAKLIQTLRRPVNRGRARNAGASDAEHQVDPADPLFLGQLGHLDAGRAGHRRAQPGQQVPLLV